MARPPDPAIPPSERLFRRLREDQTDGDCVLEDAIDTEGSSCDREKYRANPADLRTATYTQIGLIFVSDVPTNLVPPTPPGAAPWEFFAVDDPDDANEAHCEIRVRRVSKRPSQTNDSAIKKRPYETRVWLKSQLAACFHVWRP